MKVRIGSHHRILTTAGLLGLFVACSSAAELQKTALGDACVLNSDCQSPFVCAFRLCHVQCKTSRDCPSGARCVTSDRPSNVCQLAKEAACSTNASCAANQVCAVDQQCRDRCLGDRDCITGQVCSVGSCAEPAELTSGSLAKTSPPGAPTDGQPCSLNSECAAPFICRSGACAVECRKDIDCAVGESCKASRCEPPTIGTTSAGPLDFGATLGCFTAPYDVWEQIELVKDPALTRVGCAARCAAGGYPYAAVRNGNACSCLINVPPRSILSPPNACSVPCAGGSGTCGGTGFTFEVLAAAGARVTGTRPDAPTGVVAAPAPAPTVPFVNLGTGNSGGDDGLTANASFLGCFYGMAVNATGTVAFTEGCNHSVRAVTGPPSVVSTLGGRIGAFAYVDGPAVISRFNAPHGLAFDAQGTLFVMDTNNARIRTLSPSGVASTFAGTGAPGFLDGPADKALFGADTQGIAFGPDGALYVADTSNGRVRKVTGGVVSTLASGLAGPSGVAVSADGTVYVSETTGNKIDRISPTGVVTTLAGSGTSGDVDGIGPGARMNTPWGVAVDEANTVYFADFANGKVRTIATDGTVRTMASGIPNVATLALDIREDALYAGPLQQFAPGTVYLRKVDTSAVGALVISWAPPASTGGSAIVSYVAQATAAGAPTRKCSTSGTGTQCTLRHLQSGVSYTVTVIATNAAGQTSVASVQTVGKPN